MVKSRTQLLQMLLFAICAIASTGALAAIARFDAQLSQSNEVGVPALPVPFAFGSASILFDTDSGDLEWVISFSGLSGTPIGAHIHEAPVGTNGGIVLSLGSPVFSAPGPSGVIGLYSDTATIGAATLAAFSSALFGDLLYVNIHTPSNGAGEVRGQLEFSSIVVPLPPALVLLGGACAVLFGSRRRLS